MIRPSQKSVQVVIGPEVQFLYDEVSEKLRATDVELHGEQAL